MRVFVDTSALFAAVNGNDAQHARAKAALSGQAGLATSTLVLAQTWRLLRHTLHWQPAESFWRIIRQGATELECIIVADMEAAWLIGQRYVARCAKRLFPVNALITPLGSLAITFR